MKTITLLMSVFCLVLFAQSGSAKLKEAPQDWMYDPGPNQDPKDSMAQELIQLNSEIPYFPGVSNEVMGSQKFRPAYGPISWRMLLEKDSVKILFIGQDGTHIAEAAGRPATAGFGGRAHDLANHFGVDYSAAFINTYAFTIRGQYGARGVPYLKNGKVNFTSQYLDNELWLMSQGQDSPIVKWRNKLIDWIIRNNKGSLKMIVTFGGSARDTISSYVESRKNGSVGTRFKESDMKKIRMPEFKLKYAGGNNNFPVPLDRNGKDLYQKLVGKLDYTKPADQMKAQKAIKKDFNKIKNDIVFSNGGIDKSGLLHPAQLGGYDIDQIMVNGKQSSTSQQVSSLKGLVLGDGSKLSSDVLVVDLPHPTYLSNVQREKGGNAKVKALVKKKTERIRPWTKKKKSPWKIEPDFESGKTKWKSNFFAGKDYNYDRGEIGQEYYDFGTPGNRMVSKSSAKRIDPSTILLGARADKDLKKSNKQTMKIINAMKAEKPNEMPSKSEMFISISRLKSSRTDFDPGPGFVGPLNMAKEMKETLYGNKKSNLKSIFANKGTSPVSDKSVADYGHYRGILNEAKVLIIADPHGWDDIITARAMTGERGQYLQGLMNYVSISGVDESHAVLKTVPFGMDGATTKQWDNVLKKTEEYRDAVIEAILSAGKTKLILTDGEHAAAEVTRYMKNASSADKKIPVVNIGRSSDFAQDMMDAAADIKKAKVKIASGFSGDAANIPSRHLSYYARVWEGTSGDRVITSKDKPGLAFAQVVPDWVVKQKPKMTKSTRDGIEKLTDTLYDNCLPNPGEGPKDFIQRKAAGDMPKNCF